MRAGPPEGVTGPLRLAPAALVAWTILTWVTRVPLAWGDPALDATAKVLATLPVAVFVALSLATLVAWRRAAPGSTTPRRLAAALAIWSIAYWAVRLPLILVHDHPAAFLVVHAVLATVAVALSAAALVALSRWSRPTAPADAPVTEAALRG